MSLIGRSRVVGHYFSGELVSTTMAITRSRTDHWTEVPVELQDYRKAALLLDRSVEQ